MAAEILGADPDALQKKATLGDTAMRDTTSLGLYSALSFGRAQGNPVKAASVIVRGRDTISGKYRQRKS